MPDATQNLKLKVTADTSQLRGTTAGFAAVTSAVAGITAALYAAKQGYEKFIEPVIRYNKEIKDASESTGMAVEELSRFVQVGDDMGVQMGAITKALEMGTKNGFAPSIDALAELADRGNAMASTTERAAMYTKIFGRNWAELNPILEMGGRRIREMAEAQADGLVVTEEEIRKTEELRLGLDELNDNWIALRNEWVLKATPALIEMTQRQNFWQAAANLSRRELERTTESTLDAAEGMSDLAHAAYNAGDELDNLGSGAALTQAAMALMAGDMRLYNSLMQQYNAALALEQQLARIRAMLEAGFPDIAFDISAGIAGGAPGGAGSPARVDHWPAQGCRSLRA